MCDEENPNPNLRESIGGIVGRSAWVGDALPDGLAYLVSSG